MSVYNIYVMKNMINGNCYVGQTKKKVDRRIYEHSFEKKSLLGKAIRKYGMESFCKYEYTNIPYGLLDYCEQQMIQKINSAVPNGYNIHLGGQANRIVSEETKRKISKAKKGYPSPNKGKKLSEEQKIKMSQTHTGHKWTEEQKANLSKIRKSCPEKYAHMQGRKMSEETKEKMSASAKKVIHTKEWNEKVSNGQKNKIIPFDVRLKISNALTGVPHSEERKERQSIRVKKWWAERKAGGL